MSDSFKNDKKNAGDKTRSRDTFGDKDLDFHVLESIIESLSAGIVAFDTDLKVIKANDRARQLIDLQGQIDESLAKGTDSRIWGDWAGLLRCVIKDGNTSEFEAVKYELANNKRLLHIVCTPLKDSVTKNAIGGAIVIEDVTEKVNIEHQLTQAERLAAVGKLAGKVAHELNNPMDGILRYINLTLRTVEAEGMEKPVEYLNYCRVGLMRMVQIVSELLEFSRNAHSTVENMAVDEVVADAARTMETKTKDIDIDVTCTCTGNTPKVAADSLFQVFCNLIKNAADAMEGKGTLSISINCTEEILSIAFKDSGPGFPPEHAESIFKPFFTTKTHGKGTGLGLAICKDIVEKYNGRVTAENAAEGGSIFTVHLPIGTENATPGTENIAS
jgi:C4-dicarboxylate-specific signal transduction histidine kinase